MTNQEVTQTFADALIHYEKNGKVETLIHLFGENCEIETRRQIYRGKLGAEKFWQEYAFTFSKVSTNFVRVDDHSGHSVLEWISEGILASGKPFRYEGVTLIDIEEGQIKRFKSYFDSGALHHVVLSNHSDKEVA